MRSASGQIMSSDIPSSAPDFFSAGELPNIPGRTGDVDTGTVQKFRTVAACEPTAVRSFRMRAGLHSSKANPI